MVQSPSWEANWFAASQEIPRISRNPKVKKIEHYFIIPLMYLTNGEKFKPQNDAVQL